MIICTLQPKLKFLDQGFKFNEEDREEVSDQNMFLDLFLCETFVV